MPTSKAGTCQTCRTATLPGDMVSVATKWPQRPLELMPAARVCAGLGFPNIGETLQVLAWEGGKVSVLVLEACKQH